MSAVFTQHAVDRMQQQGVDRQDVAHLLGIVEKVANTPGSLDGRPDFTLVRTIGDGAVYLVRAGSLRAVLMTDTATDGVVVANVYLPDEPASDTLGRHDMEVATPPVGAP
jgi:hypothetical protein